MIRMRLCLRPSLDALYAIGAILGGVCLVCIPGLVIVQVVGRWSGTGIAGIPELSGYAMANSFFLPLAYAFRKGAHIRITLLIDRLPISFRWASEFLVLVVGLGVAGYLAVFMTRLAYVSYLIGDVSQGADSTPLWIPQIGMAAGSILLAMALGQTFVHHLTGHLRGGTAGKPALLAQ